MQSGGMLVGRTDAVEGAPTPINLSEGATDSPRVGTTCMLDCRLLGGEHLQAALLVSQWTRACILDPSGMLEGDMVPECHRTQHGLATAIYWAFIDFALVKTLDMDLKIGILDVDFPALRVWTHETLPLMCRPYVVVKSSGTVEDGTAIFERTVKPPFQMSVEVVPVHCSMVGKLLVAVLVITRDKRFRVRFMEVGRLLLLSNKAFVAPVLGTIEDLCARVLGLDMPLSLRLRRELHIATRDRTHLLHGQMKTRVVALLRSYVDKDFGTVVDAATDCLVLVGVEKVRLQVFLRDECYGALYLSTPDTLGGRVVFLHMTEQTRS